ncbi:hypothetical protein [Acinetobacter baumannii]|uniref:hypothetical protein n=1 Tax=Acinetobacter baumannii TaxID=470 RepID=UPI003AF5A1A2
MSLILKSNIESTIDPVFSIYDAYVQRVLADGGSVIDSDLLLNFLNLISENNIDAAKLFSVVSAGFGVKKDINGDIVKLYSLFNSAGDLTYSIGAKAKTTQISDKEVIVVNATNLSYRSVGQVSGNNLAILTSFDKSVSDTTYAIADFYNTATSTRSFAAQTVNVGYSGYNAYGTSLASMPYARNVAGVVSGGKLHAIRDGQLFASSADLSMPVTDQSHTFTLGRYTSTGGSSARGNNFMTVGAINLTIDEAKAINKFMIDNF